MKNLLDFITKASINFNNKYDYSMFIYKNANTPSYIVCPEHGAYKQTAYKHINSVTGCPKCSIRNSAINKTKDTSEFIQKAHSIHGNKYDYSKTNYVAAKLKVIISCNEHGDFEQLAAGHIAGYGCKHCSSYGKGRTKSNTKCTLYYFNIAGTNCHKIGITSLNINKRYRTLVQRNLINIVFIKEYSTGDEAYNIEQYIIKTQRLSKAK